MKPPPRIDPLYPIVAAAAGLVYPTVGITLLVEGAVLWALFRYKRLLFCTAAALNLLTQVVLIALLHTFPSNYWLALAAGEVLVVMVEAAGYALAGRWVTPEQRRGGTLRLSVKNAFLLSLGLNAASFTVGLALPI